MGFWPQTSSFSFERDFSYHNFCIKGTTLIVRTPVLQMIGDILAGIYSNLTVNRFLKSTQFLNAKH